MSVLGWVMAVGLVRGDRPGADRQNPCRSARPRSLGLLAFGLSHNLGLLLAYRALSIGRVSVVAPITATEGALAAVISIVLGEALGVEVAVLLAAIAVGVVRRGGANPTGTTPIP